jgi:protoporphyrinogen/coproporphyrinogen III oxidase
VSSGERSDPPLATVVVVGGGIAGLSAALELSSLHPIGPTAAKPFRIILLESSDRLGGHIRGQEIGDRRVDVGPDAFLARRPEAVSLCADLAMSADLVAPGSSSASVWSRGALRRLPAGLVLGAPTRLGPLARSGIVSLKGLARASLDLLSDGGSPDESDGDRSVGDIVTSRLGREVTDFLTGPLVGGINAGRVDTLSAKAVFPALLEASRRRGSLMRALRSSTPSSQSTTPGGVHVSERGDSPPAVFLSPASGINSLPGRLAAILNARGVEVVLSAPVTRIERLAGRWTVHFSDSSTLTSDGVVLATPARIAGGLIVGFDTELAGLLSGIRTASVVVTTYRFRADGIRHPLDGTGFLVPPIRSIGAGGRNTPFRAGLMTAATFMSKKWPQLARSDDVLIRASTGRAGDDRAIAMDDQTLAATVLGELELVLGNLGRPIDFVSSRFPNSFPQYEVGHVELVDRIEAVAARHPAFALAGASYRGIGIPACIGSGRRAARAVSEGLAALSREGPTPRQIPGRSTP